MHGKVMVTGGTGFIGSHLVLELISKHWKVIVPYIELDKRSIFAKEGLSKKVILTRVDLTDFDSVEFFIKKTKPDFIIHLAAQPLVTTAYNFPKDTLETNIMGTVNIMEAARKHKVKGVIVASSDKAYGESSKSYKENNPLLGKHPYDVSKSSADLIAQAYFKTYNLPVIVTRFGNVYGEGDLHFDRLVPGLMKAIVFNETFKVRSSGKLIRDYIYVDDVVSGYLLLLDKIDKLAGQIFNFSSLDNLSVTELIKLTEKALGVKIKYQVLNEAKGEIPRQHLDDTKIRKLGWQRNHCFVNSVGDVFLWYKKLLMDKNV